MCHLEVSHIDIVLLSRRFSLFCDEFSDNFLKGVQIVLRSMEDGYQAVFLRLEYGR